MILIAICKLDPKNCFSTPSSDNAYKPNVDHNTSRTVSLVVVGLCLSITGRAVVPEYHWKNGPTHQRRRNHPSAQRRPQHEPNGRWWSAVPEYHWKNEQMVSPERAVRLSITGRMASHINATTPSWGSPMQHTAIVEKHDPSHRSSPNTPIITPPIPQTHGSTFDTDTRRVTGRAVPEYHWKNELCLSTRTSCS